jgi:hypothetical protein
MALKESRVWQGTFTLGPAPDGQTFTCQATNIHVTPNVSDDGNAIKTACGEEYPAPKKIDWVIGGTSVQDFDDPTGFLAFCYDNELVELECSWLPNDVGAPEWSGTVIIVPVEEGGDAGTRITTDWEFDWVGKPDRVYAAPPP